MNLKTIGKIFTSKFVGTGPSSYEKRIYRAAVSQRLRNTALYAFMTGEVSFTRDWFQYTYGKQWLCLCIADSSLRRHRFDTISNRMTDTRTRDVP